MDLRYSKRTDGGADGGLQGRNSGAAQDSAAAPNFSLAVPVFWEAFLGIFKI